MKKISGSSKNSRKSIIKNVLWIVFLCLLLFCMFFYIRDSYIKWNVIPEVTINTNQISSRNIPFPAVTICSPLIIKNKFLNVSKILIPSYRDMFNQRPQDEQSLLCAMTQACFTGTIMSILKPDFYFEQFNENVPQILNLASPQLNETFEYCASGYYENCERLFIRAITDDGYCFTFNMLGYHSIFKNNISPIFDSYKRNKIVKSLNIDSLKSGKYYDDFNNPEPANWSLDSGYIVNDLFEQPIRAWKSNLEVRTIVDDLDIPNFCDARDNGYKVILHPPNELPTVLHDANFFELKTSKTMTITAEVIKIDESLRQFSPQQRECYFEHERKLQLFKSYSQVNCEYECMVNYTLKNCGCVKFSMPRIIGTRVCVMDDFFCYRDVITTWPDVIYKDKIDKQASWTYPCNCMHTCNQINYRVVNERSLDISSQKSNFLDLNKYLKNRKNVTFSSFKLTFPSSAVVETTKNANYRIQNFISDIGGLVGLFLGFSMLSLVELIFKIFSLNHNEKKPLDMKMDDDKKLSTTDCDEVFVIRTDRETNRTELVCYGNYRAILDKMSPKSQ